MGVCEADSVLLWSFGLDLIRIIHSHKLKFLCALSKCSLSVVSECFNRYVSSAFAFLCTEYDFVFDVSSVKVCVYDKFEVVCNL